MRAIAIMIIVTMIGVMNCKINHGELWLIVVDYG